MESPSKERTLRWDTGVVGFKERGIKKRKNRAKGNESHQKGTKRKQKR